MLMTLSLPRVYAMSFFSGFFGGSKKIRQVRNARRLSPNRKARLELQSLEQRVTPAVTVVPVVATNTINLIYGASGDTATVTVSSTNNDVLVTTSAGTTDTGI